MKAILTILFLAIWLPATNHCYLETAGLILQDQCCASEDATSQTGDPCDIGCKVAEKTAYKTETSHKIFAAVPMLITLLAEPIQQTPNTAGTKIDSWPSETLRLPQFIISTALPIRGPSFVS